MKRLFAIILLALAACSVALAVPASPYKYLYTQPDGRRVWLQNHGDELFHWTTDESGQIVERGDDGFLRPVSAASNASRRMMAASRTAGRRGTWSSFDNPHPTNFGDRKVLCILANFTDSVFVLDNPRQRFHDLLNLDGYSDNGAIGSVREYYVDNSNGIYRPEFDVFGPVNLSHSSKYYDDNGVDDAIVEAYELLADQINIADYDTDNDGGVDMVLFYYPGHNEAEGAGKESIWPHQSSAYVHLGDKRLSRYFCTSELKGASGTEMCGIGTTCHEFAHSLGLPDFYDVDYDKNGENLFTTGKFDLMSGGCYNDSGRRPPYLNAVERNMLGWMEIPELTEGIRSLGPVRENMAYTYPTKVEGEYFVIESRDEYKWDSANGESGLLIYHIDKSSRIVGNGTSAARLWEHTNYINSYGNHPCFFLEAVSGTGYHAFPSAGHVSYFLPRDLDGNHAGVLLADISYDSGTSSFLATTSSRVVLGTVMDSSGKPVEGARVSLRKASYRIVARSAARGDDTAETDAYGFFEIFIPETISDGMVLSVQKDGFSPAAANIALDGPFAQQDFYMMRVDEGRHSTLQAYDTSLTQYITAFSEGAYAFSMRCPADELKKAGLTGCKLESISFSASPTVYDKVYVIVDFGLNRALLRDVTERFASGALVKIPVSDADIVIPEGQDMFIGYGITGRQKDDYCIPLYGVFNYDVDGTWCVTDFLNSSNWRHQNFKGGYYAFVIAADVSERKEPELNDYGVAFIRLNGDTPSVIPPDGKTVYMTEWFLDGKQVIGPVSISTLPAGSHTYMARLRYYDGTSERVYYDFLL